MRRVLDMLKITGKEKELSDPTISSAIIKNTEDIARLSEEVEAINIMYEKYRSSHRKIFIFFGISIALNLALVIGIIVYMLRA